MRPGDQDRQSELMAFKAVNLSVVASDFGYRIVPKKSTRHSVLMEHNGDKIIVSKSSSGDYVFCSVHDPSANGTAIDFIQTKVENGCSLGRVRQLLRPYLDSNHLSSVIQKNIGKYATSIKASSADLAGVAARYCGFEPITSHHQYLCETRRIPLELLLSDRLKGRVRYDPGRPTNAIFPHWGIPDERSDPDERCLSGYEIKGEGVTMFSAGGRKGLWATAAFATDKILAVTESGIDALSFLALRGHEDIRVLSLSGKMNPTQPELLKSAFQRMEQGAQIVAAMDNDEGGDVLTEEIEKLVAACGRDDLNFKVDRPVSRGADWSDVLMNMTVKANQQTRLTQSFRL